MYTINLGSEPWYRHRIISQYCHSKRFGIFTKILAIAALAYCLPAVAQEQNAWQFGSLPANSSVSKPDDQQVYEILLKMLDRWNAHDIEGYVRCTGNRPNCWLSWALNSLTAGSNSTIPTLTGIRIAPRWGSLNPPVFKCGYSSQISHSRLLGGPSISRVPTKKWWVAPR
jgi:hypothetical protein